MKRGDDFLCVIWDGAGQCSGCAEEIGDGEPGLISTVSCGETMTMCRRCVKRAGELMRAAELDRRGHAGDGDGDRRHGTEGTR